MEQYNNYLAHHGIKGQKWGLRRYQNPDGSLTVEGRKRKGYSLNPRAKKENPIKMLVNKTKQSRAEKAAAQKAEKEANAKQKQMDYFRDHPEAMYRHRKELKPSDVDAIMRNVEFDRRLADIKKDETRRGMQKVNQFKDNINTVNNLYQTGKNAYNNIAEVNNTLIDFGVIKNGKRMTKIGERNDDNSEFKKHAKDGDWEWIAKNFNNLDTNQQSDAVKRSNNKKVFDKFMEEERQKKPSNQDRQEPTKSKEEQETDYVKAVARSGTLDQIYNNLGKMDDATAEIALARAEKLRNNR